MRLANNCDRVGMDPLLNKLRGSVSAAIVYEPRPLSKLTLRHGYRPELLLTNNVLWRHAGTTCAPWRSAARLRAQAGRSNRDGPPGLFASACDRTLQSCRRRHVNRVRLV